MSFVCLLEIHLHFPDNGSLKGKRAAAAKKGENTVILAVEPTVKAPISGFTKKAAKFTATA